MSHDQWIRKISLFVQTSTNKTLDLSQMHITFGVKNADEQSPNNAAIRVYNLSKKTRDELIGKGEYNSVILQAGYQNGSYGVIFKGEIKQFRTGRDNSTDTYVDILAADGDIYYNQSFSGFSFNAGKTREQIVTALAKSTEMPVSLLLVGKGGQNQTEVRGQVMFGMTRAKLKNLAASLDCSWSIQEGSLVMHDSQGYINSNDIVELNSVTGLIGVPEQTSQGIVLKCLMNSRIHVGQIIKLNNSDVNQLMMRNPDASAMVAYNVNFGLLSLAPLNESGFYQVLVAEHEGDTRGQEWYTTLTCLATDLTNVDTPTKGGA